MLLSRTLLLKAEPAGNLHSLDELFALAHAMEQEAADRYAGLAEEMQRQAKPDLAAVFTQLAAAEREHVSSVTRWSQSRVGHAPDPALVRWGGPETFDTESAAEIRTSRLMTPYRALSMAVRNEERAFAFWSYIAAFSKDSEIQTAAEAMAREELGHVATLRRERRRSYHSERDPARSGREGGAVSGQAMDQAVNEVDAGDLERRLTTHLTELQQRLAGASARRAQELVHQTMGMSSEAAGFGRFAAALTQADAQTIAEALTDAYLEGAEATHDPERLQSLQVLAERSIARLAWLRSLT